MHIRGHKVLSFAIIVSIVFSSHTKGIAQSDSPLPTQTRIFLPLIIKSCVQAFPDILPDNLANEQAIVDGINAQRLANGLPPLILVPELTQSGRLHARDMADQNFTSHTGSDGSTPYQRMTYACYNWTTAGENTGWGFSGSTSRMVDWWMNSPPHRAAILNPNFTDIGVGYAYNRNSDWQHYWTVNFGAR